MERNESFASSQVCNINIHLAWAQLEVYADDVERIQVLASGEESCLEDLRIELKSGELSIEQAQHGISLNIMESKWLHVSVRVPKDYVDPILCSTVSGLLVVRKLESHSLTLDTVSGNISAQQLTAKELTFKTVNGDVRGNDLSTVHLHLRTVTGDTKLEKIHVEELKCYSVSGNQQYRLESSFKTIEVTSVTGDVILASPVKKMNVNLRSVNGAVSTEGIEESKDSGTPAVQVTGVSSDLKVLCIQ